MVIFENPVMALTLLKLILLHMTFKALSKLALASLLSFIMCHIWFNKLMHNGVSVPQTCQVLFHH